MTIRDFFRIIIKLFCVYCLIQVAFYYIPSSFLNIVYSYDLFWSIMLIAIMIVISFGIYQTLIKKIDNIIDWLKLDRGFDNQYVNIGNFSELKVISIAIILIGGMMIVDYVPSFLHYFYVSFKNQASVSELENMFLGEQRVDYFEWGISGMNIVLGYLLIINHSYLAKKLNKSLHDPENNTEEE